MVHAQGEAELFNTAEAEFAAKPKSRKQLQDVRKKIVLD